MKIILFIFAAVVLTLAPSCKTCTICDKESASDLEFCKRDYSDNTFYEVAIANAEQDGYICRKPR